MGQFGMTLIGSIRNTLRKLVAVALSSTQIADRMQLLALYLKGSSWKLFQHDEGTNST